MVLGKKLETYLYLSHRHNNYYKIIAKEIELKIKKSKFIYHHYLEKSMQPEEAFSLVET